MGLKFSCFSAEYDKYQKSIDANIVGIIENKWWHLCMVSPSIQWITTCFVISSRIYKWFFHAEFWEVMTLLKWNCQNCRILRGFLLENPEFNNLYKKFEVSWDRIIDRSSIFLMNKEIYENSSWRKVFSFESYIDISSLKKISRELIKKAVWLHTLKIEYICDVPEEEKYLIAAQIKSYLYRQNKDGIQTIDDDALNVIWKIWIDSLVK